MKCDRCGEEKSFGELQQIRRIDNTKNCGSYHNPWYPKQQEMCTECAGITYEARNKFRSLINQVMVR